MQREFSAANKLRTVKKLLNMLRKAQRALAIPGRLELPTYGLGNRRSIRLSYGTEEPVGTAAGASNLHIRAGA
jgi:hypothetical protein